MPRYRVQVEMDCLTEYVIDAETEEQAIDEAERKVQQDYMDVQTANGEAEVIEEDDVAEWETVYEVQS